MKIPTRTWAYELPTEAFEHEARDVAKARNLAFIRVSEMITSLLIIRLLTTPACHFLRDM